MIAVGSSNEKVILICDMDSAKTLNPLISLELSLSDALVLQSLLAQTIKVLSKGVSAPADLSEEVVIDDDPEAKQLPPQPVRSPEEAMAEIERIRGEREARAERQRSRNE